MIVARFECASRKFVRGTLLCTAVCVAMATLGFFVSEDFADFAWLIALVMGGVAFSRGIVAVQRQVWELAISPQEVRWGWHEGQEERVPFSQIQRVVWGTRDPETGPVLFAELKDGSAVEIRCGSSAGSVDPREVLAAFEELGVSVVNRVD